MHPILLNKNQMYCCCFLKIYENKYLWQTAASVSNSHSIVAAADICVIITEQHLQIPTVWSCKAVVLLWSVFIKLIKLFLTMICRYRT